jgi:HlyD family secretion protein
MSQPAELFRAAALERFSSPEQLDRLVTITPARSWLALVALWLLIAGASSWAVLGSVPIRVGGDGILVTRGGSVYDAMASAAGNVVALTVTPGALVAKGDTIARLAQPAQQQTLDHAREAVAELERDHVRLVAQFDQEDAAKRAKIAQERATLEGAVATARQRADYHRRTLAAVEDLARSGFATRQRVQESRQALQAAEEDGRRAASDLARLHAEALDLAGRRNDELTKARMRLSDAVRRLGEVEAQTAASSAVAAPVAGRVTEIKVSDGAVVAAGMPIASIQSGGEGLDLVLYVPPEHGKKVRPGMPVRIEPSTVRKDEYGTLLGEVASISEFPVTPQGMQAVLQNTALVQEFGAKGPPYAARVRLIEAEGASGRYRWSSGDGPPVTINAGTLARARITIKQQRPIALVIPLLKQATGLAQ